MAKKTEPSPPWIVARLGQVHWGLWNTKGQPKAPQCPPVASATNHMHDALKEVARVLNEHEGN